MGLTVLLSRSGTGWSVSIAQTVTLPGRAPSVCPVQRRMADRIDAAMLAPVTKVDGRSECREK